MAALSSREYIPYCAGEVMQMLVLALVLIAGGGVWWWLHRRAKARRKVLKVEIARQARAIRAAGDAALGAEHLEAALYDQGRFTIVDELRGWPHRLAWISDGSRWLLTVQSEDVRLVEFRNHAALELLGDELLSRSNLRAQVRHHVSTNQVTFTETVQTERLRDKSVIGRAAVGAVVAGPVGAVVGALSGVGHKVIPEETSKRATEAVETSFGYFVDVNFTGGERSALAIPFDNLREAQRWAAILASG